VIDSGFGPEEVYINTETANELKTLIKETLSEYEFTILKLYLKGYSHKEISLNLQEKEKSIDNALQRIRKKLLGALNEKKGIVK
jgi:RNA polymerase sporulation-specific sigma factor